MAASNRCCVTVPSYSYIQDSISSDLLQNIETMARTSAWSSGGYILATGGACHGSVDFWVIERTDQGAPFVSGSLSINGHETTVTLVTISREMVMTGGKDGIIMLWHLSKDVNDHATLSNRPYQLLRGHTSKLQVEALIKHAKPR